MKIKQKGRVFSFFSLLVSMLLFFWMFGMVSMGCSQSETDVGTSSEKATGPVTPGGQGSGKLANEEDQKLPVDPKEYKPMPIPNPKTVKPMVKEGGDPRKPSIQPATPDKTSRDEKEKNQ